ncbi:putative permease [Mobiluncus mulieris 28-1]|uniref:Permease n=1 Tax=Mobiluncus mulieris ATCC 35239 TaxID=871571 RepID=E0QMF6_9ACTO|nr:NCS2 family permease [Mobiluncus mulieris]EEZ92282.1 putative permease [Mobiluncus mulieris 28-1]EFM47210.1 putative permease [Mobiluncus mulieris ATCC 35239]EFN93665.1 putative permease [Mobiluncus mulieris FB024-16]MCU9971554.1 NCS2 family permease [Mobiluncus mulieris]MCU9976031.1 NCS2 family permease [Mobiluncus mulieris]
MSSNVITGAAPNTLSGKIDSFFEISKRGSTFGREVRGGFVTFFAMAYILVLNPIILSHALPKGGSIAMPDIAAGTALIAGIMTILMGVVANYPMALAAGLGLNAMVAFTLVLGSGLSFQEAMGLIFWEGVVITVLVLTGFREAVFRAVPRQMKTAISVGIGLFIAFIGLINGGIIRPQGGTVVGLGINGSLMGWPALVFVFGFFLTVVLYAARIKGSILIGIMSSTVLAVIVQLFAKLEVKSDKVPTGWGQTVPQLSVDSWHLPSFGSLGQIDFFGAFGKMGPVAALLVIFSLMLADFFDTMGTMVAIGEAGNLLDKEGNPPRTKAILIVDSLAAIAGGLGGVSSNTSYVESSTGVGEGARTGFAAVVTGVLFLVSIFLAPLVEIIPSEAASTALVFVGFLMMVQVTEINWKNLEVAIPSFMTIIFMPFAYSISVGIGVGFVTFLVVKLARGKIREISPLMWIVSILFVIYFCLGPIQALLS